MRYFRSISKCLGAPRQRGLNVYHFNPPKVIEAEVFMRLPDYLRRDKAADLTPWARQQHPGVPVAAFLEGPSFDRAGNLYCVDIAHGRIFRTSPDGSVSV